MLADSDSLCSRGDDSTLRIGQIGKHPAYKVSYAYRVRLGEPCDVARQTLDHAGADANRLQ
jgi:hypothetical protein